jgi:PadR family transcriptional regulator PadR
MKSYQLGEFEEVVLLTVGILHGEAYGVSIKKEIESRLSRSVSLGALHTALVRLEKKGFIRAHEGESTTERVGRPKRYVEMTALGKKALENSKEARDSLWNALPKNVLGIKKA